VVTGLRFEARGLGKGRVHARHLWYGLAALASLLMLSSGCPSQERNTEKPAGQETAAFIPSEPIPIEHPLLDYAGLWLGMNSVDISQAYSAPEGLGDGFTRGIERYGDVAHHTIRFDLAEGEPRRKIIAAFFRDQLYFIVDRREGLTSAQGEQWFQELKEAYGENPQMTIGGAQWIWGDGDGVSLTYTQDNASETYMTATVVLVHQPTRTAAHNYLIAWEEKHPVENNQ